MGLTAKRGDSKSFEPVAEGLHPAVCWAVIDLGIQTKGGKYPGEQAQVYLGFDVLDQSIEFEKDGVKKVGPMRVGLTLTNSLGEKAKLRKHLEKWRGRPFTEEELDGFELGKLVGQPCQILVTHAVVKDKTYANIDNILKWPANMDKPNLPDDRVMFNLDLHRPDDFKGVIPSWLMDKINARLADNWDQFNQKNAAPTRAAHEDSNGGGTFDDDIPF
jgi:hypothetical protein